MRNEKLQAFIDELEGILLRSSGAYKGRHVAETVFKTLATVPGEAGQTVPADLQVLRHLPRCLEISAQSETGGIGRALEALLPRIPWKASQGYDDKTFSENHANAVLVGKGGIEERADYTIGISLAAPRISYPMHNHPPEELYLTLAGGEFRHGEEGWTTVATGQTFYNTPGIIHAMRAIDDPLLAIWIFGAR